MKTIALTQGQVALVDDSDFEWLSQWKWHSNGNGYAVRTVRCYNGKQQKIFMHREILNTPPKMQTDHKDGNSLNNQRMNLRICNTFQNRANSRIQIKGSSKYKGVAWDKSNQKWRAQICVKYKTIRLGRYDNEEFAARVYDEAAQKYFGEFARTNF